jgi:hypothetical protein
METDALIGLSRRGYIKRMSDYITIYIMPLLFGSEKSHGRVELGHMALVIDRKISY